MIRRINPQPLKDDWNRYKDDGCPLTCYEKDESGKVVNLCPFLVPVKILIDTHCYCDVPDC